MIVRICTPLRSYTQSSSVEASGADIGEILADLDAQFPGIRFRVIDEQGNIRPHMRIYLDDERARTLDEPVGSATEVTLMQALSGG